MSESQEYEYTPNSDGSVYEVYLSRSGKWKVLKQGTPVLVGKKEKYYDFSF
jgi:hypothetical protein